MSTRHNQRAERALASSSPRYVAFSLFDSPGHSTTFSATHSQHSDDAYLWAWLRSRLEDGTWALREESALTATSSDRAQVTRLAQKARALGLAVWPQRARKAVA